ncbi:TonB-dependent receptor [Aestuariicella hydrocarbonica]|uniref:TonB-dependent receptor n=1 Tax=Pseudomaricurvus hydrocarbonicus TaxID=1470433 RepID=A0A9E5MN46_9GAMM|nr:TonB-dependent receptor [Aestuariicella hydrocarbonica]NHO67318.1 TonB-dependent receptor [Aestuariicella hydrocarbonica]
MKVFNKQALALGIAMATVGGQAMAQQGNSEERMFFLEEIVVTAQKREQSLNDVPVSVAVVTGDDLKNSGTQDFQAMADSVPSLSITNVANITAISIRGIGTTDNGGFEQSVGLFIDGVQQPKDRLYRATSFLDVGSIQVLRGPQGTLFGKNTTAGAMMLTSNRPTQDFEGSVTTGYTFDEGGIGGNNGGYSVEGFLSGGLTNTLSARLTFRQIEDEGYFTNFTPDGEENVNDKSQQALRLSVLWQPNDNFDALLKLEKGRVRETGEPNRTFNHDTAYSTSLGITPDIVNAAAMFAGQNVVPLKEGSYAQSWNTGFDDTNSEAATLTMNWYAGEYTLMSISGHTAFDYQQNRDSDWISADLANQDDTQDYDAFSQEFRLVSPQGQTVEYVAGLYYQTTSDESNETRNLNASILGLPNAIASRDYQQDGETYAIYGNADIHLADNWTLTLGVNYTYENKDATRDLSVSGDPGASTVLALLTGDVAHHMEGDRSVDQFNSSVKLSWNVTDETMLYVSAAQAFKSGGFDETGGQGDDPGEYLVDPAQFEFDDEKVLSMEVGGKGTYLDGRLSANWAAFYVEMTDRQFSRYVPGTGFIVGNSGQVDYSGVELETQFLITENLKWDLQLSYLNGEIVEPISSPNAAGLEKKGPTKNANWGGTNTLSYDYYVGDYLFNAKMVNIYDGATDFNGANLDRESTVRTNLRFGFGSSDGAWDVAFLVNNVTDEEVVLAYQQSNFFDASAAGVGTAAEAWVRPPRSYMLQGTYNF